MFLNLPLVVQVPGPKMMIWRAFARRLESDVTLEEPGLRVRPQVRVKENIGFLEVNESDFSALPNSVHSSNSCLGSLSSACARRVASSAAPASARVFLGSSSLAVSAAFAHAHASILHDACSNSWSDTGRVKGPTGRRCTKGGVSGPAEDLRPVSQVNPKGARNGLFFDI